jgi:hypothetical protein
MIDFRGDPAGFRAALGAYNGGGVVRAPGLPAATTPAAGTPAVVNPTTTPNALSPQTTALNNFANSAGMQFQLQQGANEIQNMYADHGALQSGAAMKALQDYGQKTALQNYFMPYMGLLGGQQAVGAQAGSAVAGVGSSFGNTAANINSNLGNASSGIYGNMGGAIQSGADAASNAALIRGANNANIWSGVGSALGNLGSSFLNNPSGSQWTGATGSW